MADYRSPQLQQPPRKPLPGRNAGLQFHSSGSTTTQYRPPQPSGQPMAQNRPRTASSSVVPAPIMQTPRQMGPVYAQHPQHPQHPPVPTRRLSNATTSTSSTGGYASQGHAVPKIQTDVRRSSSSRSNASAQSGYVALMRKQKATVWCDRAQPEDPRIAAQRRAAKQRAMLEVTGGAGRSSTLASGGKIRHNANSRSISYNNLGTMMGAGVPLRLSANEVGDGDDELDDRDGSGTHRRTGSGRSSTGSNRFRSGYERPSQPGRFSNGSGNTPPSMETVDGRNEIPEIVETPAPLKTKKDDQSPPQSKPDGNAADTEASGTDSGDRPGTSYSFSSEHEDNFGKPTELAAPSGAALASQRAKTADELRRRGSVDDRTTTMTGVRLFIANPDLSD